MITQSHPPPSAKIFVAAKHPLAHECHFPALHPHFAAAKWAAKMPIRCEIHPLLRNRPSAAKIKTSLGILFKPIAKTRGAKSSSPSTHLRIPRESPVQAAIPEPPWPLVVPPSVEDAPMSPPSRHYQTRRSLTMARASSSRAQKSGSGPPKKKAKVSEPIDLTKPSSESPSEPQPSQPPPQRQDHSTPSSVLTQLLSDFSLSSGIPSICYRDGRHGILGARHIAEALRIPYEPARPKDYRVWTHSSQSDIVHILSKGASSCQYLLRKEPLQHVIY
ncbi:hypothetical protein CK203_059246 [Vitis vinifera]|uniref:Uncharacterized protein n=1 Tax=Vitis vinifera TaxID=29760 RepID=A0A438GEA5_VITVI|nr:hypothetical protein CK203_059246 [Vitis vinifera]